MKKIIKSLASIKLAVFIIIALAVISTVGTVFETNANEAYYAQKLVYTSWWMISIMALLIVNLTAVMVDRWPWKVRHTGFVCAHIGIIIIIFGSWVTQKYGIDGSMVIELGKKSNIISLPERQFVVYKYDENVRPKQVAKEKTQFLTDPQDPNKPFLTVDEKPLFVKKYFHFAERDEKIFPSDDKNDGAAIRFLLSNDNVSVSNWMRISKSKKDHVINLGPARLVWDYGKFKYRSGNVIHLYPIDAKNVGYKIYSAKAGGLTSEGVTEAGTVMETGWMGLQLRLFNYYQHSRNKVTYFQKTSSSKATESAILVDFDGKEYWMGLGSTLRLFSNNTAYLVAYTRKKIPLNFKIGLKKFHIGRYQGTFRASSYEADVVVPEIGDYKIYMNDPLKYKGLTFYQSSFIPDEQGGAKATVLSVNQDPGRFWKNLGSLIMVFGILHLFYYRKWVMRKKKRSV